jgi:hypothetical protein
VTPEADVRVTMQDSQIKCLAAGALSNYVYFLK